MAQIESFDAETVEPNRPFELLPAGWYPAQFIKSEVKATKSGGSQLTLDAMILEGHEYAGRHIFVRLNLWNASPAAVEIAQRDLSAICRSVGVLKVDDSEVLHMIPLAIKLKVRPAEGSYGESNDTCGFDSIAERCPSSAPTPAAKQAAKPAAAASATPWKKK